MISNQKAYKIVEGLFSRFASNQTDEAMAVASKRILEEAYQAGQYCKAIDCEFYFMRMNGNLDHCRDCLVYGLESHIMASH